MEWYHFIILFAVAFVAGAMNSVAGGGTLLTFPALLWAGHGAHFVDFTKFANATSTVALWPAALGSFWGYRGELPSNRRETLLLALPSLLGGLIGALLLTRTADATFARLVPWLILLSTMLFVLQTPLAKLRQRWTERNRALLKNEPTDQSTAHELPDTQATTARWGTILTFQFMLSIYGGYFGAGIGILMLAAFSWLGFTNIHHMNALKNLNGMFINGVAATMFIYQGLVHWPIALVMGTGAIAGGFAGAGIAKKIGQVWVRRTVIMIGFSLTAIMLLEQWLSPTQ